MSQSSSESSGSSGSSGSSRTSESSVTSKSSSESEKHKRRDKKRKSRSRHKKKEKKSEEKKVKVKEEEKKKDKKNDKKKEKKKERNKEKKKKKKKKESYSESESSLDLSSLSETSRTTTRSSDKESSESSNSSEMSGSTETSETSETSESSESTSERSTRKKKKKKTRKTKKKDKKRRKTKSKTKRKKKKKSKRYREEKTDMLIECAGWVIETGTVGADVTEFDEIKDIRIFRSKFIGHPYSLFAAKHEKFGHVLFAITKLQTKGDTEYLILAITKDGDKLVNIKKKDLELGFIGSLLFNKANIIKSIEKCDPTLAGATDLIEMEPEEAEEEIIDMENERNLHDFKCGVILVGKGYESQRDILNIRKETYDFRQLIKLLGTKVKLKNFKGYRGGLDTETDGDGTFSRYTTYRNYGIMYHIITYLPYDKNDKEQVPRKRHIGNDIVIIAFIEKDAKYDPRTLISHQHHVLIAIQPQHPENEPDVTTYKVQVARKEYVSNFKPYLPDPPIFKEHELMEFLKAKIVSAERATKNSGVYKRRMSEFKADHLEGIYEDLL
ncbi:rap gtpase-activating protein [Anaeramoeba flamelloides]|uniref:Rap gtpase-activating protein n=1 Tax=Anaeramoeba flamelloides TaxID=1746091 RepID=A0AAV8A3R3_9EUKA|nr:rap gtpase-activating protein [Anaeramoeba flamelloides]